MVIYYFILCIAVFSDITRVVALNPTNSLSRREVLIGGGSVVGTLGGFFLGFPAWASDTADGRPIAVLGASGRTGALCVTACLERGIPVRALTRSGSWPPESMEGITVGSNTNKNLLTVASCDVRDSIALQKSVEGCRGVIYAASASKQGGNAKEIDNLAVVNAGDACLKAKVGRYVIISSTAVTRPKSLGYVFTNVFGGIMDEKRKGEQGVMDIYKTAESSSYTILRPGGLEEPKLNVALGPSALEISQGDTFAGIVSRADLAELAVELVASNAPNLRDTALELYYTDSAQACEGRFKPLLTNGVVPRLHGTTYDELLYRIQPNLDYYVP